MCVGSYLLVVAVLRLLALCAFRAAPHPTHTYLMNVLGRRSPLSPMKDKPLKIVVIGHLNLRMPYPGEGESERCGITTQQPSEGNAHRNAYVVHSIRRRIERHFYVFEMKVTELESNETRSFIGEDLGKLIPLQWSPLK
ncbi:hypothetical protein BDP27DRAFT_1373206 [Rhodocollybia butyracea]|uniref:Uncharacterized protein n=1 Tax=Rhodocollybia butyracea TaxID=206335 RepID=A0A9P5P8A1_9AGAR|nr:hypothetical protein BDP27DRAFT_1373206 [Rhodocollybia butyracea]